MSITYSIGIVANKNNLVKLRREYFKYEKNKILRVLSLGLIGATAFGTLASCGEKKTFFY